jgi:hypothetical protein
VPPVKFTARRSIAAESFRRSKKNAGCYSQRPTPSTGAKSESKSGALWQGLVT